MDRVGIKRRIDRKSGALLLAAYSFANRRDLAHNCRSLSIRLFGVLPESPTLSAQ